MDEGLVPSIGHLWLERQESPFSLVFLGKRLAEYKFCFWKAMIEQAGGIWIVHTNDKDSFLKRVWDISTAPPAKTKVDCAIAKTEWVSYPTPAKGPPWLINPPISTVTPVVRAEPPIAYVKVGIVWRCRTCDFDLYAR
jgi:hypothetical protein